LLGSDGGSMGWKRSSEKIEKIRRGKRNKMGGKIKGWGQGERLRERGGK